MERENGWSEGRQVQSDSRARANGHGAEKENRHLYEQENAKTRKMERVFKIVLRSVDSGGICSGRASGVSPEMYVDGTESIPRCSRAPRKLSSPPEWSLFTCTSTVCLLMVGMRREGTKQGGWERAGRDWVKRPCPNTATSKVPIFEDSLLDVACQGPP